MSLRFSRDLTTLLEKLAESPLTLADVLAETAERGFCLALSVIVLPFLFPLPPGLTTILGPACLLLSLQMMLGRKAPWLPKRLAHYEFPRAVSKSLLENLHRVTRLLEKVARPRWVWLAEKPYIWRLNGLCIFWLTILLMLPIPFTNPVPTAGILLMCVATLEADGLLMCICYGFLGVSTFGILGLSLHLFGT